MKRQSWGVLGEPQSAKDGLLLAVPARAGLQGLALSAGTASRDVRTEPEAQSARRPPPPSTLPHRAFILRYSGVIFVTLGGTLLALFLEVSL